MKRKFSETHDEAAVGDFDYQAKLAAIRNNPDKAPANVNGRITWVDACKWLNGGIRCKMIATIGGYCRWHYACLDYPQAASDYGEFLKWREGEVAVAYHPDFVAKHPMDCAPERISPTWGIDPTEIWKWVSGGGKECG